MKKCKWLVFALVFLLLMTGCGRRQEPTETTAEATTEPMAETTVPVETTAATEPIITESIITEPVITELEIVTPYCNIIYDSEWVQYADYEVREEAIGCTLSFYCTANNSRMHLFDICFGGMIEGIGMGMIEDNDGVNWDVVVNIPTLEFDSSWTQENIDIAYFIQEDINLILEKFEETGRYTPN